MKDKELLFKILTKVCSVDKKYADLFTTDNRYSIEELVDQIYDGDKSSMSQQITDMAIRGLLTDHKVMKAIFGEDNFVKFFEGDKQKEYSSLEEVTEDLTEGRWWNIYQPSWQYHLQQMVLEENLVQYFNNFLDLL